MPEKKMPKHKRLYKDSPRLERGEDGKMASVKPSEKEDPHASGEPDGEPLEDARMQEIKDMHKRHQTEMAAIHKRHQSEDAKRYAKKEHDADNNESDDAGKKEIKKIDEESAE